jgi:proteasome activator subunit 4
MFIVAAVQHIKIGDLTAHPSGLSYSNEDDNMQVDRDYGQDSDMTPTLSKEDERSLVRDSTASFAGELPFFPALSLYLNFCQTGSCR